MRKMAMVNEVHPDGLPGERRTPRLAAAMLGLAMLAFAVFHLVPSLWLARPVAGGGEKWEPWIGYRIWGDIGEVMFRMNSGAGRDILGGLLSASWLGVTAAVIAAPFLIRVLMHSRKTWWLFFMAALVGISGMAAQYALIYQVQPWDPESVVKLGPGLVAFALFPVLNLLGLVLLRMGRE